MIIAQNMNPSVKLTDYYSYNQHRPYKTIIPLNLINYTTSQGIYASFNRLLSTGNSLDQTISRDLKIPFSYAYLTTNTGFFVHDIIGDGIITFGSTQRTSSFVHSGDFFKTHGVYMTIIWLAIVQVAIIVMRYFKW